MTLTAEEFIAHYGVKGMRWGIRNEEKSGPSKKSDSDEFQSKFKGKSLAEIREEQGGSSGSEESKKGLSRNQKIALGIVGGVAVAGAAYGAYKLYDTGEFNRMKMKGQAFLKGEKELGWKKNAKLADPNASADQIFNDVSLMINPDYGAPGTTKNCLRASFAHEIARRGHEVEVTKSFTGAGQHEGNIIRALTPGRKIRGKEGVVKTAVQADEGLRRLLTGIESTPMPGTADDSYAANIFASLARDNPERARGTLNVWWKQGGGHAVNWEIIEGKAVIFDGQTRRKYHSPAEMLKDYKDNFASGYSTRLDNVELNPDLLSRWVKDA